MKYLKIYEQFDEEDNWWEEKSPFDILESKLKIVKFRNIFLLVEKIDYDGRITAYNNHKINLKMEECEFFPINNINKNIIVRLYKKGVIYNEFTLKELPKEILDRII